jgi:hypothetical protein
MSGTHERPSCPDTDPVCSLCKNLALGSPDTDLRCTICMVMLDRWFGMFQLHK